ncbi:MAG: hypothetical protein KDC38_07110, partial [Planctomycetes bacterium]|nr:hypothetical protein [Planctomycetota bacterium]
MPPVSRSACLTKLDVNGAIVWNRAYEVGDRSRGIAVRRANDDPSHYVMVGYSDSFAGGDRKVFVMKTDDLGNPLWTYSYAAAPGRTFMPKLELRNVPGDGYIVCGTVEDGFAGFTGFLLRIDDLGGLTWMRTYPVAGAPFNLTAFNEVQPTPEGFVVTGYSPSQFTGGPVQNSQDTFVMTTDMFGNPIWANQYANLDGGQDGESIAVLPQGQGYAIVGGHLPTLLDSYTTELFRLDAAGNLQWYDRIFGVMDTGSHYKSQQVPNGDLRALPNGDLVYVGGDFTDAALFRFDGAGNFITAQSYGFALAQWGTSFVIEPTGEFTVVGATTNALELDYYVVRADASFMSGCNENTLVPPIDHPPIEVVPIVFAPNDLDGVIAETPVDVPLAWTETVLCSSNPCLDPFTVTCTLVSGDVVLDWGPALPGVLSVEVRRNGTLLATLPGPTTSYTDTSPPFGSSLYEVTLIPDDPMCDRAAASCSKFVPIVVISVGTDVIFHPAKPVADEPTFCIWEELVSKGRNARVISHFEEIATSLDPASGGPKPIVWLSLGEFPEEHELTQEE